MDALDGRGSQRKDWGPERLHFSGVPSGKETGDGRRALRMRGQEKRDTSQRLPQSTLQGAGMEKGAQRRSPASAPPSS